MSDFVSSSIVTGALGDFFLQGISKSHAEWGFKSYFKQHGFFESIFIASGMMALFSLLYVSYYPGPIDIYMVFLYGGFLDILFRYSRIMPSLDAYYDNVNPFLTFVWGGIPFVIADYFLR